MKFNPDNIPDDQYYTLPFDSIVRWNIREFGPFLYTGKERFHSNEQNKLPSVQKNNSVGTG